MSDPTPPPNAPSEPLAPISIITGIGAALVGLAVSFGLNLTADQKASTIALITAAAPIVVWLWGRRKTYSPATVRRMLVRGGHEPGA